MSSILAMAMSYTTTNVVPATAPIFYSISPRVLEINKKNALILFQSPTFHLIRNIRIVDVSALLLNEIVSRLSLPRSITVIGKRLRRNLINNIFDRFTDLQELCLPEYSKYDYLKHPSDRIKILLISTRYAIFDSYEENLSYDQAIGIASKYATPEFIYNNVGFSRYTPKIMCYLNNLPDTVTKDIQLIKDLINNFPDGFTGDFADDFPLSIDDLNIMNIIKLYLDFPTFRCSNIAEALQLVINRYRFFNCPRETLESFVDECSYVNAMLYQVTWASEDINIYTDEFNLTIVWNNKDLTSKELYDLLGDDIVNLFEFIKYWDNEQLESCFKDVPDLLSKIPICGTKHFVHLLEFHFESPFMINLIESTFAAKELSAPLQDLLNASISSPRHTAKDNILVNLYLTRKFLSIKYLSNSLTFSDNIYSTIIYNYFFCNRISNSFLKIFMDSNIDLTYDEKFKVIDNAIKKWRYDHALHKRWNRAMAAFTRLTGEFEIFNPTKRAYKIDDYFYSDEFMEDCGFEVIRAINSNRIDIYNYISDPRFVYGRYEDRHKRRLINALIQLAPPKAIKHFFMIHTDYIGEVSIIAIKCNNRYAFKKYLPYLSPNALHNWASNLTLSWKCIERRNPIIFDRYFIEIYEMCRNNAEILNMLDKAIEQHYKYFSKFTLLLTHE